MLQLQNHGLLQRLDELRFQLPRSERRIAETVLDNPEVVSYMRLNELAQAANVSIATVHRFCRSLGCEGFKELRQEISRSVSSIPSHQSSSQKGLNPVASNCSLQSMIGEVSQSLTTLHSSTTKDLLNDATEIAKKADRAIIFSTEEDFRSPIVEGSALLYKAGLPCEHKLSDKSMERAVPTLKQDDLAIFVFSEYRAEHTNWIGAVKQMGSNSVAFSFDETNQIPATDVVVPVGRKKASPYDLLMSQINLTVLFTHLSTSITLAAH